MDGRGNCSCAARPRPGARAILEPVAASGGAGGGRFGLYVIGDELLSGRRSDRHLAHVIALLRERELSLGWAQFLPDDRAVLECAFRQSLAGDDIVFSCGGIGATPDDHTRQAAAAALGSELVLHPGARDKIAEAVAKRGLLDLA